jgi:hypothetical protein
MHNQLNRFKYLRHGFGKSKTRGNSEAQDTGTTPLLNRPGGACVLRLRIIQVTLIVVCFAEFVTNATSQHSTKAE